MIKSDIRYTRRFSSERFRLPDNKLPFVKKKRCKNAALLCAVFAGIVKFRTELQETSTFSLILTRFDSFQLRAVYLN